MNIAFIGFEHGHIFPLYQKCREHPDVTITGAWEPLSEYRAEAERRGVELTHEEYHDLLHAKEVDAVAVGVYFGGRGKIAIEALQAGKHVIADKPLCTELDELLEIERLAAETGLSVGLMLDLRYMGVTAVAKEIIDSGRLGAVHAVNFGGQHGLNYGSRAGWYFEEGKHGGTINDIAIHGLDLITYLTGKEVSQIHSARCWNAFADKVPYFKDAGQLMVELEGGAGVVGDVTYASPGGLGFPLPQYWRTTIWGTGGVIEFNCTSNKLWAAFPNAKEPEIIEAPAQVEADYLTDFLADIAGNPTCFDTKRNLDSTKTLLKIQQFADK
ncbi:MAG: Gfo/Idh/MocA family oxidoreductase [Oscillospiraceae bacterium]|jgi:predicted dehydrogenase|nr:Gfo/Idh/MocA family oxidoreductase [Oscillospiraceae bacterium]